MTSSGESAFFSTFQTPMQNPRSSAGFTLIEMLVVIAIIATLAAFAVPALTNALARGQMTGTMNNARQLFIAAQQMALDGAANSDPNYGWPGGYEDVQTLEDYATRLVNNDYLKAGDLQKLLNAPGVACSVTSSSGGGGGGGATSTTVDITGRPALKVYKIVETDGSNTLFATSNNYTYNQALPQTGATSAPYADKGFVVVRKGGDAAVLRKNQATVSGFSSPQNFQSTVGMKTGDQEGSPTAGDGEVTLTGPSAGGT